MAETEVIITQDRFGRDVTIPVDENGNIILYRATDDPNRIIDSDFRPLSRDKGSVGLGQQSYFSPNPMYSHKYQSSGRANYKFATQIKSNEILPTDDFIKNYPELVSALNIPEEYTNQNWRQLVNNDKAMIAMGYEAGGKRFFNDNIQTFLDNNIKAFGSGSTGSGGQTFIEYEIIPLVKEGDTLGIKPIATLQTKEGFAAGKSPEAFIETLLDTPTNVIDDVVKNKGTINEWFNEAVKEYDLVSGTPTGRKDLLRYSDFEEFLINKKGLKKETAEKIIKDIKTGVVTQVELGPTTTTGISPEFAKATGLTDIGISQNVFRDFGVQNYLDTVYTQASDLSSSAYNMSFADRQALQNTFYDSLINSDDVVEIYLRQVSSVNVPAESVYFRPELVQEVPGFYTEPIGGLTPGEMASGGGINPTENFYKLEINKNNLLIDVPGVDFSNELKNKLDWNLLQKELGINYSQFKDIDNYQLFHTKLSNVANDLGIDNTKLYSTLRKSGYEGTVGYVNRQVEVVLLDPNDDLGIGKKVNFENSNVDDFFNNQSKVNQLDELVIKSRNVASAEVIDNLGKTTTNFVDNLPLETIVKNRVKNLIGKKSAQAATPGGLMDAVDVWEFSVLGLMAAAVAFKEYDEIPTIITNKAVDMFNSMTSFYGIPPVQKKEYDLDYKYITQVLDTGEKFMPTDIIIKKGVEEFKEGQESGVDISAGLGAQAGVFNNSITTPAKTDTMETTQKIQPGVQEEKMFEQARPKKNRSGGSGGGSGARIE